MSQKSEDRSAQDEATLMSPHGPRSEDRSAQD